VSVKRQVDEQLERMAAGSVDFVGLEELRPRLAEALAAGRPLRIKLGMDPSAADLHLGHSITLEKLKVFQELGHTPIFLVGDFTARIGDPTGKNKARPPLDPEQIRANAETYVSQVSQVLDVERAEIRFNSEWMDAMSPTDFVRLCSRYTVARMLERDDFSKRYREGVAISVHEFLYPLVQAYDSVALEADVELGGTDQLFNLLVGREIQRDYGQLPQAVMTHPLLVGPDGKEKMSKSLGNTIGITDPPAEIYGRTMSISDDLMADWIPALSFGQWDDLDPVGGDPLATKQELARRLVDRFHGEGASADAEAHFRRVIQQGKAPDEIPEVEIPLAGAADIGLLDVMRQALELSSNGEARRLVTGGGVRLDERRIDDPKARLVAGDYLLQAGKRRYARIQITSRT
jgi:tyrosyl-tRNA synthetase